ncbi:helix-turn-helix domain-containing protein [Oceanobacillus manasiensis]|uniref:helix-turn-helix domain-containing protein n=1 Tax=Oceanobacillus manasiensis TaxID=586413 RepID=UPI0005A77A07|nr:AraC family transcriptional regulator [Oceanobacillus manasiensis]
MVSDNQIICEKRSYSKKLDSHAHAFGQFLFPLQGTLDIATDRQEIHLGTDHCFYVPPYYTHSYRSRDRNEFLILDIPTSYLPVETEITLSELDSKWSAIRSLLLEEAKEPSNISTGLPELVKYVGQKLRRATAPSIDYIHRHFRESIQIEDLAAMEHYHPVYYSSWFKEKTGKTPKAYIAELRLNEAKRQLRGTTQTITRISEEIGFENSSSFTRWFTMKVGTSPQNYRRYE